MVMPLKAIDRLFDRLTATYGRQFTEMYAGVDPQSVKTTWAMELDYWGTQTGMQAIAWALENLPERAPNAIQFKALVRNSPPPEVPRLPEPKADPERLKAELNKLGGLSVGFAARNPNKDWAKRIVAEHERGGKIASATLKLAREALNERSA